MNAIYKATNGKLNKIQELNLEVVANILTRKHKLVDIKVPSDNIFNMGYNFTYLIIIYKFF